MSEVLIPFERVSAKAGIGRTAIYAGIAAGTFPKPVKVGKRSLWVESEIDTWIAERIAERDMGQKVGSPKAA